MKFKADLIYGASHTRKTTNLARAIKFFWETQGLKSRVWSADGGGFEPLALLIDAGVCEVQTLAPDDKDVLERINQATQGHWPNAQGKMEAPKGDQQFGVVGFEGLYSLGELVMARFRHKGTKLQQGPSFDYIEGNTAFHGGNVTYYGMAQDLLRDWVRYSHGIPNAKRVIWTSLEDTGDNEVTRRREGGPAAPGTKLTTLVAQWFCNTIHLTKEGDSYVAHLNRHSDKLGTEFAAGIRAPMEVAVQMPATIEPADVYVFYSLLKQAYEKALQQINPTQTQTT